MEDKAEKSGDQSLLNKSKCRKCNEEVKSKDKALSRDICQYWTHIECEKVTQTSYNALMKLNSTCQGIKWLCETCDKLFGKLKLEMTEILDKQNDLNLKQQVMETKLDRVIKDLTEVKKVVEEKQEKKDDDLQITHVKVNEEFKDFKEQLGELKSKWSEVLVKGTEMEKARVGNTATQGQTDALQDEIKEAIERDKRMKNLVIFGINETNDPSLTFEKVKEIVGLIGVEVEKVKYIGRVGRAISGGKTRLVRITCEDNETRRNLLKGAMKLKNESGYERIYISPDLTKSQQVLDKKLREKLKELRVVHKEAKISNGDIIKMEGSARIVLFSQPN